ncbi:MAG: thioredoxin domain-containing protein [Candidatus Levybacteria bacterium]|nr:thioredoxin domain-containing protein [Candidatus Levybacteria bacterium]
MGLKSTPTFGLNGKIIPNPKGYEDFKKLIDEAISEL